MFFGVTVLLLMVIVFVATAPDGGVVGLLGPEELELLLEPHAARAHAAARHPDARKPLVFIRIGQLDLKTLRT